MTAQTLSNIIAAVQTSTFSLDADTLGSKQLASIVGDTFSNGLLKILSVESKTRAAKSMQFRATVASFLGLSNHPVDFLFFVVEDQLECLISSAAPKYWNFNWAYPNLPGYTDFGTGEPVEYPSLLGEINFIEETRIQFSSVDPEKAQQAPVLYRNSITDWPASKLRKGLNFSGNTGRHGLGIWGKLGAYIGFENKLHIWHAHLIGEGDDKILWLAFDRSIHKSYANFFEVNVTSVAVYTSISIKSAAVESGVQLTGAIGLGQSTSPSHGIVLDWPIGGSAIMIRNAEPIALPGLDTFEGLLDGHLPTGDEVEFPISADKLTDLYIRDLRLSLPLDSSGSISVSMSVGPSVSWHHSIIDDVLDIEDLLLHWQVDFATGKYIRFDVLGGFRIGGGLVNVSASYPDFVFSGDLAIHETIILDQIVHHFAPDVPKMELSILDLELSADLKNKSYEFVIDIASDWHVELGSLDTMPLKNVYLELEKDEDGTLVTVDSTLEIAGVDVMLMATNAGGGEKGGWTFSGETDSGQNIHIVKIIEHIAKTFGGLDIDLPSSIEDLVVTQIGTSFNTGSKDFSFQCSGALPIGSKELDILVHIDLTHQGENGFEYKFSGQLFMAGQEFDLIFDQQKNGSDKATTMLATFHSKAGIKLDVHDLLEGHVPAEVADAIPHGFTLTLNDVLLAHVKSDDGQKKSSSTLFGIDMGSGINLSNLPLVGDVLPPDQTLKLGYRVLVATHDISNEQLSHVNDLLPSGIASLSTSAEPDKPGMKKGLDLATNIQLGTQTFHLDLPVASKQVDNTDAQSSVTDPSELPIKVDADRSSNGAKWISLQKSFGPVHIEKIGGKFADGEITFLIDAAMTAAGLTISLDGLGVSSPLSKFDPHFSLQGLGIDYNSGPVEVGGAFLALGDNEYAGTALVKTEALTLSAIGSYKKFHGETSLFVYAVLDYPLGGPSFFFVTGMAGGFGYNRAIRQPAIDHVKTFPLVEEATRGAGLPDDLTAELGKLKKYVPMDIGQYFLALGVKFTSFKMVDSFALITVSFGNDFEVDLLGLSTLIVPTPEAGKTVTPLAEVQVALRASYVPEKGFLGVDARLTSASYVLSKDCHLTGGFAFWSWFSGPHEGDFVVTLGGYHPSFKPPAHYPKVPRLGFNWQVTGELSIKGGIYYALTSHALMAGGSLKAVYHDGAIKAWFEASADFLISWKPYHYDARIHVGVGVSYSYWFFGTHHISVDVSADLHVWGPDFAGTAHVHLWIVSFTVGFGASGNNQPKPIDWATFKQSFLPPDDQICSLAIQSGLIDTEAKNKDGSWVVNAKHLCLTTNSIIPSLTAKIGRRSFNGAQFDIGSMGILGAQKDLESFHIVTIKYKDSAASKRTKPTSVEDWFRFEPVLKKAPTGLWGAKLVPDVNDAGFVEDTLAGFTIVPAKLPLPGESHPVDKQNLLYETEPMANSFGWEDRVRFGKRIVEKKNSNNRINTRADDEHEEIRRAALSESLQSHDVAKNRSALLQGFGIDTADIRLGGLNDRDFLRAPEIGEF